MNNGINNLYEFGKFRFDVETRTLWFKEKLIPLPPKATDVLFMLLEAEGKLVTKNEILNKVWADTFVEDGVLTQSIYQLRQALSTEDSETQYIENIARRGYRLAENVRRVYTSANPVAPANLGAEIFQEIIQTKINSESEEPENVSTNFYPLVSETSAIEKNETKIKSVSREEYFKKGNLIFIFSLFFILVITIAGFFIYRTLIDQTEKSQTNFAPIEQLKFERLTDYGNVIFPTISPNGEMMAFIRHEEDGETLWIKQLETEGLLRIFPPSKSGFGSLVFSPDNKFIYYREGAEGGDIFQVSILGGTPKKVAENAWSGFSLSKDGNTFSFYRKDAERNLDILILSKLDGSGERELGFRELPKDFRAFPSWSPDGKKIAIVSGIERRFFPKLSTINTDTGEETELTIPEWRAISNTLWLPNGKNLIISARHSNDPNSQLWMLDIVTGEIRRLTNDLESYFWISLSEDGSRLITRQQRIILHIWNLPDGKLENAARLTSGERRFDGYGGLTWISDEKIIYSVRTGNTTNLYSMNRDGTEQIQLTENEGLEPYASNDSKYIVFTSSRNGSQQIWRMNADGQNQQQLTFSADEIAYSPTISPDSREIYFLKSGKNKGSSIYKIPIEGGTPQKIFDQTIISAQSFISISPDGNKILFRQPTDKNDSSDDESSLKFGIISINGSDEPISFDLSMRRNLVEWSSDKTIDYFEGTFNTSSLNRLSIEDGKSQKLLDFPERINNFAWSKNGKYLAISRGKQLGDAILITNLPK